MILISRVSIKRQACMTTCLFLTSLLLSLSASPPRPPPLNPPVVSLRFSSIDRRSHHITSHHMASHGITRHRGADLHSRNPVPVLQRAGAGARLRAPGIHGPCSDLAERGVGPLFFVPAPPRLSSRRRLSPECVSGATSVVLLPLEWISPPLVSWLFGQLSDSCWSCLGAFGYSSLPKGSGGVGLSATAACV